MGKILRLKFIGINENSAVNLKLVRITGQKQEENISLESLESFKNGVAIYEITGLADKEEFEYRFIAPRMQNGKIQGKVVFDYAKANPVLEISANVIYPVIKKNIDFVLDFSDNQNKIGEYNQYECNLKVTRNGVEVKNFTTDNVRIKNTENGKVTWEVKNLEVDDQVKVDIKARNGYFHQINDEFSIEESTKNSKIYKSILNNEPKHDGNSENGILEITVNAPKQRKLTELTNLEFKAQIKTGGITKDTLQNQVNKINESETSITWQVSNLRPLNTVIYEIKSLDSEGQNEIAPVSDSVSNVYRNKVTKSHVLTFLKEKKSQEPKGPEEEHQEPQGPQKHENKEPKYEGLDNFSENEIKEIKIIMEKNSCFDHLRASRHFFQEGIEKSPKNAVITKESLKAFLKEFKYYLFSRDDIKLYKLLKSKLNN